MNLLELYPESSTSDLQLYFQGTVIQVRFPYTEEWVLREIGQIVPTDNGRVIQLRDSKGVNDTVPIEQLEVRVTFPPLGYYNWRLGVLYLERLSQRQNKKGMCNTTLRISEQLVQLLQQTDSKILGTHPVFKLLDKYWFRTPHYSRSLIELISENPIPRFSTISSGWDAITKHVKVLGRALSSQFALSRGIHSAAPALWFDSFLIGEMPDKETILITNPLFFQEASDFFSHLDVNVMAR